MSITHTHLPLCQKEDPNHSKLKVGNINDKEIQWTWFPEVRDILSCSWRASSTLWTAARALSISKRANALSSYTSFLASSEAYKWI